MYIEQLLCTGYSFVHVHLPPKEDSKLLKGKGCSYNALVTPKMAKRAAEIRIWQKDTI